MARLARQGATPPGAADNLLHPSENIFKTSSISTLGGELIIPVDGKRTISLDLRGTFVGTFVLEGSIDGINYPIPILLHSLTSINVRPNVGAASAGTWSGACGGFLSVRVRSTAFSSGAAIVSLVATDSVEERGVGSGIVDLFTTVSAVNAANTFTIGSPGAGLRIALKSLYIERINNTAAALVAGAGPTNITSTGLPGNPVISMANDALPAGAVQIVTDQRWDGAGLMASSQNSAVSFTVPAQAGMISRVTATWNTTR